MLDALVLNPLLTQSQTKATTTKPPAVQTVTVGGIVKTVTATPEPTPDDKETTKKSSGGGGLKTGAIVGIVIGVIGGLAVLGAFLLFLVRRRRQQEDADNNLGTPIRGGGSPGMMGTPKTEISENRFAGGGAGAAAAGPASGWDTSTKRRSHLMPVDPRLDPYAKGIYAAGADQNQSRESFNSLQDNQDYSRRVHAPRVLRAMNPDPDDN